MRRLLAVVGVTGVILVGAAGTAQAQEPEPAPGPVHCYPLSLFCEMQVGPFQFDVPINFESLFPAQP